MNTFAKFTIAAIVVVGFFTWAWGVYYFTIGIWDIEAKGWVLGVPVQVESLVKFCIVGVLLKGISGLTE